MYYDLKGPLSLQVLFRQTLGGGDKGFASANRGLCCCHQQQQHNNKGPSWRLIHRQLAATNKAAIFILKEWLTFLLKYIYVCLFIKLLACLFFYSCLRFK